MGSKVEGIRFLSRKNRGGEITLSLVARWTNLLSSNSLTLLVYTVHIRTEWKKSTHHMLDMEAQGTARHRLPQD